MRWQRHLVPAVKEVPDTRRTTHLRGRQQHVVQHHTLPHIGQQRRQVAQQLPPNAPHGCGLEALEHLSQLLHLSCRCSVGVAWSVTDAKSYAARRRAPIAAGNTQYETPDGSSSGGQLGLPCTRCDAGMGVRAVRDGYRFDPPPPAPLHKHGCRSSLKGDGDTVALCSRRTGMVYRVKGSTCTRQSMAASLRAVGMKRSRRAGGSQTRRGADRRWVPWCTVLRCAVWRTCSI